MTYFIITHILSLNINNFKKKNVIILSILKKIIILEDTILLYGINEEKNSNNLYYWELKICCTLRLQIMKKNKYDALNLKY